MLRSQFQSSTTHLLRFLSAIALCLLLLILGPHVDQFNQLRSWASTLVLPVRYMVDIPMRLVYWTTARVETQQALLADNAKLRAHELLLEAKLQKLLALERENASLRSLLSSSSQLNSGRATVAQILAIDMDPGLQQFIIDKGEAESAYPGQPVLDAYGVLGQVIDVGHLTSRVLLVTDVHSAVPVEDSRNGVRSVVVGEGNSDALSLLAVPDSQDIQVGDQFVTSGLGLHFPMGYPVGKVVAVVHEPGKSFAQVLLTPAAHIDRSQEVLLVSPDRAKLAEAVDHQLNAKKAPGG